MEPLGLTIENARRALGGNDNPISRATIYRLIAAQKIEAFKAGGRTLVTTDSLKQYAAACPRLGGA